MPLERTIPSSSSSSRDLLRADGEVDRVAAAAALGQLGGQQHRRAIRTCRVLDHALDQVRDPDEAGDELLGRVLVDVLRRPALGDAAVVHDRDPVRHRERLLLVVGDVDEGDPDLALDRLQLDLHLLAELQVQGAERLVEQQHLGPVDERPGQRDPLALPAGELVGPRGGALVQVDELERLGDAARISSLSTLRRFRPKATLSATSRWSKSA